MILFEGPETVAAVFLEPVQNSGGCFPPPPGYFQRVREICDQYDVLLVSDEVICAFGRIGHMFACDAYGYVPDMITCAKAMTSGYSPIGATIVSEKIYEPFATGTTSFYHGYTFGGHPVSAAVALANLDIFEEEGLNERVRENSPLFRAELEKLLDLPIVGDVRGDGYFFGIELVKDKATQRDVRRRRVRAAAARLPLEGALRRRPVLPRRRPRRPRDPAGAAAHHRRARVPGDRADPARRCSPKPRTASDGGRDQPTATASPAAYRGSSFWLDDLVVPGLRRSGAARALTANARFDVCIVGGGLTGCGRPTRWRRPIPTLRIAVLEREIAGFGASGRNGGWCSALFPRSPDRLEREHGFDAAVAMRRRWSTRSTRSAGSPRVEGIDCDFERGGTVVFARNDVQRGFAKADVAEVRRFGVDRPEYWDEHTVGRRFGATGLDGGAPGAMFDPACARVHPAKLVRGLAEVVESLGVFVFERTEVLDWAAGRVRFRALDCGDSRARSPRGT